MKRKQTTVTRRCFKCEKKLTGSLSGKLIQEFNEAPNDAIVFSARGNWGSAVLDQPPYKPETLEISICDDCIVQHHDNVIAFSEVTTRSCVVVPIEGVIRIKR